MALDNFGRGYSSFNAIPLLPVSVLKLDGNFTSRLATDATVRILTRSAITLMHDIDITVTATGVGQEDQFDILAGSGCDGQVLVYQDMLGLTTGHTAKFVKRFADVGSVMRKGIADYISETKEGTFPAEEHTYAIEDDVIEQLMREEK